MGEPISRRRALSRLSIGLSALGAATASVPILGYLLSPLLRRVPQRWLDLGSAGDFALEQTVLRSIPDPSPLPWAGQTARTAVWVRRTGDEAFVVFAVNCPHLGCPVNWQPEARLFLCPCHGGVFYADGSVASGPATRSLVRYESRVRGGQLQVRSRPLAVG